MLRSPKANVETLNVLDCILYINGKISIHPTLPFKIMYFSKESSSKYTKKILLTHTTFPTRNDSGNAKRQELKNVQNDNEHTVKCLRKKWQKRENIV